MMWDDHDITDGWEAIRPDRSTARWSRAYGARRASTSPFFQLAAPADDLPEEFGDPHGGHFGWAYRVANVGLIAPDLRSERDRTQVLGEAGRNALTQALASMSGCDASSLSARFPSSTLTPGDGARVPVHFPGTSPGRMTWSINGRALPIARNGPRSWVSSFNSRRGQGSRSPLFPARFTWRARSDQGPRRRNPSLTSSGIVHPPAFPARRGHHEMGVCAHHPRCSRHRGAGTANAGSRSHYLRARNWMELELPHGGPLLATWHPEADAR
jgi:hypothetical protein